MQMITKHECVLVSQTNRTPAGRRDLRNGTTAIPIRRWVAILSLLGLSAMGALVAHGADPVVQEFYLPMPEDQVWTVFNKQAPFDPPEVNMVSVFSIVVTTAGTMIYYDQWENGYEANLSTPTNIWSVANPGGTQIWGDGDDSNGICPGFDHDPVGLPAGTVIALRNDVPVPRDFTANPFLYDGGDRIGATKAVTISRACWESYQRGTSQATAVEVLSTFDHGAKYIAPIGTNVAANGMFTFVDLLVMADNDNTTVVVDPDGTGTAITTHTIDRGATGAFLVNDIGQGAKVTANQPIQVHMITGNAFNGQYETRSFVLRPVERWSSQYIIPVGTSNTNYPGAAYLFNTNTTPLLVTYTNRSGNGTLSVPGAAGLLNGLLKYKLPLNSGTLLASTNGMPFFVICAMDTSPSDSPSDVTGADMDWGFAPIPFEGLTTEAVCGWGPGADTNSEFWTGTENGNPVWITAVSNTMLYVVYGGNHIPPLTDPKGNLYDTNFVVSALESKAIYDHVSNDQTGLQIYTLDGTVIAGAWGEDASVANPGPPFMDMGYALAPFPTFLFTKSSRVVVDTAPTNVLNVGDVLEYTLRVNNRGLLPLGNLFVSDALASQLRYVPHSTTLNGSPLPDDIPGVGGHFSPFPLDEGGYPVTVQRQDVAIFTYQCQIRSPGSIVNSALAGDPTDPNTPGAGTTNLAFTLVSITNASVIEGNSGTTNLVFLVTLSSASTGDVSVAFATSDGTATAGSDYLATNGTLTIPAGETTGFIVVKVIGDVFVEPDETLFVTLSNVTGNAVIIVDRGTGTILNDDHYSGFFYTVSWTFNPRRDSWYGTLSISNAADSEQSLTAPTVWFDVQSNANHRLRFPAGADAGAGSNWFYVDLSTQFLAAVSAIGNHNQLLDPGESVVVCTNIELWGRGSVTDGSLTNRVIATNWVSTLSGTIVSPVKTGSTGSVGSTGSAGSVSGPTISGKIVHSGTSSGVAGVKVNLSNNGGSVTTDATGAYQICVPSGWNGAITPSFTSGRFTPLSTTLSKVTVNKTGQNFSWKP